jgi:FKBP-type peptidyl-prolyl cis-trans isomerase
MTLVAWLVLGPAGCHAPDVEVQETDVEIVSETAGIGRPCRPGDHVRIAFHAALPNGEQVLNDDAFAFVLGAGTVIEGVDEAVRGMKPRGVRVVRCPPHKHWGSNGYGERIPPNAPLTFHITLLSAE